MRYSIFSAALLSLSTLAAATSQFSSPKAGDSWQIGIEQTITWDTSALTGPIDAHLVPGGAQDTTVIIAEIATQVGNQGSLKWTPNKSISAQQVTIIIIDSKKTKSVSDNFVLVVADESSSQKNSYGTGKSSNNSTGHDNKSSNGYKNINTASSGHVNKTIGTTSQIVASVTEAVAVSTTALAQAPPTVASVPEVIIQSSTLLTFTTTPLAVASPTDVQVGDGTSPQLNEEPTTTIAIDLGIQTGAPYSNSTNNFVQATGTGVGVQSQQFTGGASSTLFGSFFAAAAGGLLGLVSLLFL